MRRVLATLGVLVIVWFGAFAGPAAAQDSPPPGGVSPTSIVRAQGGTLQRTGSDVAPLVMVSLGLAATGTVLVVASRRRRHRLAV